MFNGEKIKLMKIKDLSNDCINFQKNRFGVGIKRFNFMVKFKRDTYLQK
jgi:hypothetical protein